ncbi:patatin-like phospholipase family protein [bacterium]|nr:patatin-like phospholipase family protein [bacterium]
MSNPRVGLVLGSGSSRGWAHIGVIEALQKYDIQISAIAATSSGSFIGASFASGGLGSIKKFALDMDWKRVLSFLDIAFPRSGFIDGHKVAELIQRYTKVSRFEELSIPVHMVATDMFTGEQIILSEGSISDALRASMAVPGLITPILIGDRWLVDGGVVNPLPVDVCRQMETDLIIAVDLNSERIAKRTQNLVEDGWKNGSESIEKKRLEVIKSWIERYGTAGKTVSTKIDQWFSKEEPSPHIFEVLGSSLSIMQKKIEIMNLEIHKPDILIQPRLGDLKFFDFDQAARAIDEGYQRTVAAIPEIRKQLLSLSSDAS